MIPGDALGSLEGCQGGMQNQISDDGNPKTTQVGETDYAYDEAVSGRSGKCF